MTEFNQEDSQEFKKETPAERAVRFKEEEDNLQQLLLTNDASGEAVDLLIGALVRKHKFETENNANISMDDFLEIENMSVAHKPRDRKSTRLNSSHSRRSRMPSSA